MNKLLFALCVGILFALGIAYAYSDSALTSLKPENAVCNSTYKGIDVCYYSGGSAAGIYWNKKIYINTGTWLPNPPPFRETLEHEYCHYYRMTQMEKKYNTLSERLNEEITCSFSFIDYTEGMQ